MIDLTQVLALEERALNAWPALQTVVVQGWALRLAGGCTKRANSANALVPGGDFADVRRAAEALYARHGLPTVFRLSPLAGSEVDAELEAAGYSVADPSSVLTVPLAAGKDHASIHIDDWPTERWLHGVSQANGISLNLRPMHDAIARMIAWPSAFATLHEGNKPVGFGLAVCERELVGLFDIVVAPAARGRGHGRTLTRALLAWGEQAGAQGAYLQVRHGNAAAERLYASLGFDQVYNYHYRVSHAGLHR